jgi:hypothetical protein
VSWWIVVAIVWVLAVLWGLALFAAASGRRHK